MSILQANGKEIDTRPIRFLVTAGEKNADSVTIQVDRYYSGGDLSGCTFTMRGINAAGEIAEQVLQKRIEAGVVVLLWRITDVFTAVPGTMQLELCCTSGDDIVMKYQMQPITIHCSPSGSGIPTPDASEQILSQMEQLLGRAQELTVKMPILKNGTWWIYNPELNEYEDSGQAAQGTDGKPGENGLDGTDGLPGADGKDGKSAYNIWLDNGNTGTEADFLESLKGVDGAPGVDGADGTDGKDGQDGKSAYQIWLDNGNTGTETDFLESLKGTDGAPGSDGQNGADGFSPTANVEKSGSVITITVTDINGTTTASITEGAAVDLTPYAPIAYVDGQIQNVHTHSNLETLEEITETIWVDILEKNHSHPNYVAVNALTMTHLDNISQCANAIQELKLQIGDIQTALANIVEVTE